MRSSGSMQAVFMKNIGILLVVNLLVKAVYIFFIDAQAQNLLGERTYGQFFELFNFCILFMIVLDPGIQNYNTQLIAKEPEKAAQHFRNIAGSRLILIIGYGLIVLGTGYLINYPPHYYHILPGIMAILILGSIAQYLRSHFASLGRYHYEAWLAGLDKVLMIVIIGYFIYFRKEITLFDFVYGQLVALALSCIVFILILSRLIPIRLHLSIRALKALVLKSYPYGLVLLLMAVYTRIDGVMLGRLLDDNAYSAGLYARSFRLLDAANMIGIMFAALMLPMFAKLIDQHKALNALVQEVLRLLFPVCLMVCMVSWHYDEEIMDLIYTDNTFEHYKVFRYLMLGFLAMGLANVFGCLFLAAEKLKKVNYLFATGILINVSANYFLIPSYGAFGAVVATLVTQAYVFLGMTLLAVSAFRLRLDRSTWLGFIFISVVALALFRLSVHFLDWNWVAELILISFLVAVLAFLCGFLRFPFASDE